MVSVDEFDLADERVEVGPVAPARRRRRLRHGPGLWAAAALVLVVVGTGAAPDRPLPIGAGTEQTPPYGIIDVDLTEAPEVAWSVGLDDVPTSWWPALQQVGETVITATDVVSGFDAITAEPLWQLPTPTGVCSITTRVVCTAPSGDEGVITSLDPATGATTTILVPDAVHAVAVEDVLVVALDGERLVGIDGDAGETRWETQLEPWFVDTDDAAAPWLTVAVLDEILVVGGPSTYAVDARTGDLQTGQWSLSRTAFGAVVDHVAVDHQQRYLIDADGRVTTRSDGLPPQVDDGVGGDIRFEMIGPLLQATYADGLELWTLPGEEDDDDRVVTFVLARLAGVVMTAGVGERVTVSGHDQLTGEQLWRLPEGSWPDTFAGASTTLLRLTGGALVAMDVRTGDELWRHQLGDVVAIVATDDGAIALTRDALTRLVWA